MFNLFKNPNRRNTAVSGISPILFANRGYPAGTSSICGKSGTVEFWLAIIAVTYCIDPPNFRTSQEGIPGAFYGIEVRFPIRLGVTVNRSSSKKVTCSQKKVGEGWGKYVLTGFPALPVTSAQSRSSWRSFKTKRHRGGLGARLTVCIKSPQILSMLL